MRDVNVVMKDGREFCGPLWVFRPKEGWLQLATVDESPEKIYLRDVKEAVEYGMWDKATERRMQFDVLARAREEGWNGK